ncbi:MAG TPA: hypothetical protein VFO85_14285, partial [Vicinamibacteria bacterium]|nr:hypothetical protein [Vicinamibacteria bacterium]
MLVVVVWMACGSSPGTPTPSPSPTPIPGGPVIGRYLLQLTPAANCTLSRAPLNFPMVAAAAGTAPHPGLQVLVEGDGSRLELELLTTETAVRGGLGTTEEGVLAQEGLRVWIRGIAAGSVFQAPDGRGQVPSGTLSGEIALAEADGEEGDLGSC